MVPPMLPGHAHLPFLIVRPSEWNCTRQMGEAIKREESQFDRLHFALQKAKSDSARMHALQRLLDARRAPPQ